MAAAYDRRESAAASAAWMRPGAPGGATDVLATAVTTDPLGIRGGWPAGFYAIEDRGQGETRNDPRRGQPRGSRTQQAALAGPRSFADLSDQDAARVVNLATSMLCNGRRATNRDGRVVSVQQCLRFHGGYVPLAIVARAALVDELALRQLLRSQRAYDGAGTLCFTLSEDGLWVGAACGSWREAVAGLHSTREYAIYETALAAYEGGHWVHTPPPDLLPEVAFVPKDPQGARRSAAHGPGRTHSHQARARSPPPGRGGAGPGREWRQGGGNRSYGASSSSHWWGKGRW